jgi:endonuclease-3
MQLNKIDEFFRRLSKERPTPKSELDYVNAFTFLVAVVLSAQATDVGVNKATKKLFASIQTPEQMLKLGEAKLKRAIANINFLNTKARNIINLSKILIEKFGSEVPHTREELQSLPGVGRKTANVVLNVIYGAPTIAVDTHVFRVANRTGLAAGETPEEVENKLAKRVPKKWTRYAHHWLILHGRYICKARAPICYECVVRDLCAYKNKTGA